MLEGRGKLVQQEGVGSLELELDLVGIPFCFQSLDWGLEMELKEKKAEDEKEGRLEMELIVVVVEVAERISHLILTAARKQ